jgi:hypothetical protein
MHTILKLRGLLCLGALALAAACTPPPAPGPVRGEPGVSRMTTEGPQEGIDTAMAIAAPPPPGAPTCPPGTGWYLDKPVGSQAERVELPATARRRASIGLPADPQRRPMRVRIWETTDTYPAVEATATDRAGRVALRMSWAGCTQAEQIESRGPAIYRWEPGGKGGGDWRKLENSRRVDANTVEADLESLSRYAVGTN